MIGGPSRWGIVTYPNYLLAAGERLATSASASQSRYSASVHPQSVTQRLVRVAWPHSA